MEIIIVVKTIKIMNLTTGSAKNKQYIFKEEIKLMIN
jgi:hypothetical protein